MSERYFQKKKKKSIQAISFLLLCFSFNEELMKPEIVFHVQASQKPSTLCYIPSPTGFPIHFTLSPSHGQTNKYSF